MLSAPTPTYLCFEVFKIDCDVIIIVPLPLHVHQGTLDKQLYRVERKYSMAERKLQEQKEKERQNKVRGHTFKVQQVNIL